MLDIAQGLFKKMSCERALYCSSSSKRECGRLIKTNLAWFFLSMLCLLSLLSFLAIVYFSYEKPIASVILGAAYMDRLKLHNDNEFFVLSATQLYSFSSFVAVACSLCICNIYILQKLQAILYFFSILKSPERREKTTLEL